MNETPRWSRSSISWLVTIVAAVGLIGCCGGLAVFGDRPKNGVRVEQLEADLRGSLPMGSTWKQAEAWFASHKLQPMDINELGGKKIGLAANIPNDSLLKSAEIRLQVYFDDAGGVRKIIIYRFVYSL